MSKANRTTEAQPQTGVHPYRWVILALTSACFILTFVTRFVWPPLIPVLVPILGIKMSEAGAYMSAFYIGYVITQIPAGVLSDYFGVRLILALSLVIEGISTFGMGYMSTYDTDFALRVLTGIGAGAVYAACARALMEWFPPKERGTAFGVMLGSPAAGILLASIIVPPLNGFIGWQGVFKSVGLVTALVGVLVYLLIRTSSQAKTGSRVIEGFKIVLGSKDLMLTALCGFCLMWNELGTATWTFAHIKHLGLSLVVAGSVMMFYSMGGFAAPILSGLISDKIGRRKYILMVSLAVTAPATVIFGHQTSVLTLSVMGFIFGFCSYFANPHLTIMISEFAGQQYAATANGASNFIFQLASMIGPFLMGWSIDVTGSFASVWWIMAAGPIMGIFLLIPVNEENKRA